MLSNDYYYFALIRKYISIMASLFDGMVIQRTDAAGNLTQIVTVPIDYAEKDTMITRMKVDPDIEKPSSVVLPRISFFLDGQTFDVTRKTASNGKYIIQNKPNITWQYKEVPWNFHFRVWFYVKNNEDASKMLEQVLPFFTPTFAIKADLIPNRDPVDLWVELNGISHTDDQSTDFKQRTTLIWELQFTMKAFLYGPIQTSKPIKVVDLKVYDCDILPQGNTIINENFGISNNLINTANSGSYTLGFEATEQPAMEANGQPNAVPLANINYDDNWSIVSSVSGGSTPDEVPVIIPTTLNANGTPGNAGQILATGANNTLYWADITSFPNLVASITATILANAPQTLTNALIADLPVYNGVGPIPVEKGQWYISNGILTQAQ